MAGPFQVGDIVTISKVAWTVYQLGWSDEHNATRQYNEFGRDVRGLAESLDILSRVVLHAQSSLHQQGARHAVVRWDPVSLGGIIGDYKATLRECDDLIRRNNQYRAGSTVLRNLEWNALVQPTADRLRQRIALHNSKILHMLKPFEIDVLFRVREDIRLMHHDLADRITALHRDVHKLMGVVIADLDTNLRQQEARQGQACLLNVPQDMAERFRLAALVDHPYHDDVDAFRLEELSDAFVLNYHRSTINFQGGVLVPDRIPSLEEYLNLLKCVWLLERMKASRNLVSQNNDSHWPSYVSQLEADLSTQCSRFDNELVQPQVIGPALRRDMLTIWPEAEEDQLVDVVTQDEMMDKVLEVPLKGSTTNVESSMKLLRRLGTNGKRFRIVISGSEKRTVSVRPKRQTEIIDFDIMSHSLNPQYALSRSHEMTSEYILRRDERIARLSFTKMSDLLRFQQAITGYQVWARWTQYDAMASFVVTGRNEPIVEKVCVQLWIPRTLEGTPVTSAEIETDLPSSFAPSRSTTLASTMSGAMPIPQNGARYVASHDILSGSPDNISTGPLSRQGSVPLRPGQLPGGSGFQPGSSWHSHPSSPPRAGYSPQRGPSFSYSPGQPQSVFSSALPSPPTRHNGFLSPSSPVPQGRQSAARSASVSSVRSGAASSASNSSASEGRTTTVSVGANGSGFLHRRPPRPLLVLFTQHPEDGQLSFVTVQLDEKTSVNPERCNCRQSGRDGASCRISAIEQAKGDADLCARRYDMPRQGEMDWNIAQLSANSPASSSERWAWRNLKRLSILFPSPSDRATFGGTPNRCRCNKRNMTQGELQQCLGSGHRGYLGEVLEYHRRKGHEYYATRYEGQEEVVNGLPT